MFENDLNVSSSIGSLFGAIFKIDLENLLCRSGRFMKSFTVAESLLGIFLSRARLGIFGLESKISSAFLGKKPMLIRLQGSSCTIDATEKEAERIL